VYCTAWSDDIDLLNVVVSSYDRSRLNVGKSRSHVHEIAARRLHVHISVQLKGNLAVSQLRLTNLLFEACVRQL
jgi:hypothetical protein